MSLREPNSLRSSFRQDFVCRLHRERIFRRNRASRPVLSAANRSPPTDGVLCNLFPTLDQSYHFPGRLAHCTGVPLQLAQTSNYAVSPVRRSTCLTLTLFQNAYLYLIVGLFFLVGSSLLIHMVFFAAEYKWMPNHSKETLFLSAVSPDRPR